MSRIDFGPDMDIRQFRKRHLSQDFGEEEKKVLVASLNSKVKTSPEGIMPK